MPHDFFCHDCQSFEDLSSHTKDSPKHRMTKNRDDVLKSLEVDPPIEASSVPALKSKSRRKSKPKK